jgi:hypothetical protein
MLEATVTWAPQPAAVGPLINPTTGLPPNTVLCSRVPGRERWYVNALEDNPRLAASVEFVLRSEEGVLDACVNPLTGRVLVHYRPELLSESIEALLHRALEFGPMSREEFSSIRSDRPGNSSFRNILAAEIGCTALKLLFLGGFCPIALGAAGLLFFMHRRS